MVRPVSAFGTFILALFALSRRLIKSQLLYKLLQMEEQKLSNLAEVLLLIELFVTFSLAVMLICCNDVHFALMKLFA